MNRAIDEILDFVTSSPTLYEIKVFTYSNETLSRVTYLNEREADNSITVEEAQELREFQHAAHVMEQLKIRAERRIKETPPLGEMW